MSSQYEERSSGHAESVAIKIFVSIIVVMGVLITIKCLRRVANGPPRASAAAAASASLDSSRSAVAPASIAVVSLPIFVHRAPKSSSEEEDQRLECAVCLAEFEEGEEGRVLPSCCHKFHTECVTQWFLSNTTCPLCRSSVEPPV